MKLKNLTSAMAQAIKYRQSWDKIEKSGGKWKYLECHKDSFGWRNYTWKPLLQKDLDYILKEMEK